MSTRTKMIHVRSLKVVRVNLHPSTGRISQSYHNDSFRARVLEMNRRGYVLINRGSAVKVRGSHDNKQIRVLGGAAK